MSNIVRFDEVRFMAGTGAPGPGVISASFQPIGLFSTPTVRAPFTHAMRVLHFINETNGNIAISFDGTTVNIIILASTFALYDLTSDQDENESFRYEKGTQIYVKYLTAPSQGDLYIVAVFGKGE